MPGAGAPGCPSTPVRTAWERTAAQPAASASFPTIGPHAAPTRPDAEGAESGGGRRPAAYRRHIPTPAGREARDDRCSPRRLLQADIHAFLQPLQAAPDPRLHRAERLPQMARQLGMREAIVERQRDGLALRRLEALHAALDPRR